jgi:DNA repair protein RadC
LEAKALEGVPVMTRREWQQLELHLPVAGDVGAAYETRPSRAAYWPASRPEVSSLSDAALLAEVLGSSTEDTCNTLIAIHGSLRRLSHVHPADLRELRFKPATVRRLAAVFEIARRYGEEEFVPGAPFRGSADIYAHYRERLAAETVEHFIVVLLDNKHRKIKDVEVGLGSLTATVVHPRDVYSRVLRDAAAAVIFVHNHPSGDATPSREDLEITRRLREVGELIGVSVLDHVIVGKGRYVSFVDDGYW